MSPLLKILPGTGRWTRSGRRGPTSPAKTVLAARWDPSVSPFGPATSPFRGGLRKVQRQTPVTLNSFQGPLCPTRRSVVGRIEGAVGVSTQGSGRAARWMLKQVQHDGWEEAQ